MIVDYGGFVHPSWVNSPWAAVWRRIFRKVCIKYALSMQ